ncbi:MAG: glycosyltransferase family 39 protein [Bacteroidales bacterium]|nr:glycosyltransferase family 39 protein [Bacteroidales bacterium]
MKKNSHILYFIFIIGLFFSIISRDFLTEGMFVDGTYYSVIAHKISSDQCSFWKLRNCNASEVFYSHPPLAFQTQSWFLDIFGDNVYCDKIYSVLTYIITGFIICLIWKKLTGEMKSAWMPLLFWTTITLVQWGATNNLLENTMTIFIVASIYFCLNEKKPYFFSILAGAMIYLAFMVKGPTALFPFTFPVIQYFFQKEKPLWKYLLKSFLMAFTSVAIFSAMLLISEDSRHFFKMYYNIQIQGSFENVETVSSRFYIIWKWFGEMIFGIAIIVISFIIKHKSQTFKKLTSLKTTLKNDEADNKNAKNSLMFLLAGLCGVIPIMVSMKQREFYILPTMPFFAISMALIFKSIFKDSKKLAIKYALSTITIVAAIALNIFYLGKISREKETLRDIKVMRTVIPNNEIVLIPNSLVSEYSLRNYMSRLADITLTTNDEAYKYLIMPKEEQYDDQRWQSKYKPSDLKTEKFNLYINESFN